MRFALDRYGSRGNFFFEMAFYLHKEFRAAGIRFLSTQRIGGGDLEENGHFLQEKRVARKRVADFLDGGDLKENGHFR